MKKVVEEGLARIGKYKKAIEHSASTINVIKQVKAKFDIPSEKRLPNCTAMGRCFIKRGCKFTNRKALAFILQYLQNELSMSKEKG